MIALSAICIFPNLRAQNTKVPAAAKNTFSLTVASAERSFKMGSAIFVDITIQNLVDDDLTMSFRLGQVGVEFPVEVWDEKGRLVPETQYGRVKNNHQIAGDPPLMTFKSADSTIARGKSITDRMNVSQIYDFGTPGKYAVQISQYDEESNSIVKSNKTTVTVTP